MKDRMRQVKARLRGQWEYLPPVGWAALGLALIMGLVVTVSTVAAHAREGKPTLAEQAFEARWRGAPAGVDRGAAEQAVMNGQGYLWADSCHAQLYAGGRIIDVDPTWLSENRTGGAIKGTRAWGCGSDSVPGAQAVRETPAVEIPRVAADADAAARAGFPYLWQTVQGPRTYMVVEVPAVGTFAIERRKVDNPHQQIPAEGQWVPNTPDFFGR